MISLARDRAGLAAVAAVLLVAAPATAEAAAPPNVKPAVSGAELAAVQTERQALFPKMLADPTNVALALRYVDLSEQAGDLEGAISTLERLLIYAPQSADLNFRLGVLYYRLGAFGQAAANFRAVTAAPGVDPDLRAKAETYASLSDRQATGNYLTGSVTTGIKYQTNANGGASASTIDLGGIEFELDPSAMAAPDYNAFLSGTAHASVDLQDQGDRLDAQLQVYASKYRTQDALNTLAGEVTAGPIFDLSRFGLAGMTIGVYGIGNIVALDGDPYLSTLGAGTITTVALGDTTSLNSRLEFRNETYESSMARPTASDLTGPRTRATEGFESQLTDWMSFYGSVYGERKDGVDGIHSDWEAGATLGTRLAFGDQASPVTVDLSAGIARRQYDDPDLVFSTDARRDKSAYVQGVLTVPLSKTVSAIATAAYSKQLSNYDLYTFDNVSGSLAVSVGF